MFRYEISKSGIELKSRPHKYTVIKESYKLEGVTFITLGILGCFLRSIFIST